MEKTFQPDSIEQRWYQTWEEQGYFKPASVDSESTSYSVAIPPPNVTGSLHMGHAFQHTIMDALIRYQRMKGKNTLWQVGTDHAGIATQMVVERKLAAEEDKTKEDLGREQFIDKIWQWKAESGGTITRQMRRLGNSVDWSNERFTMDDGFSKAVQEAFVRLYEDGLIYRGKRLVNWDPKLQTAISDIEVENKESKGYMWQLRYPLADGAKTASGADHLVVATTRPETMLGDTGIAVNAQDPRFKDLIGKYVTLPLLDRRIPIIGDDHADMEKGTGCVKITPAHDFNDYAVGQRHELAMINILDKTGHILQRAEVFNYQGQASSDFSPALPAEFGGLERFKARKAVVAALDAAGYLESIKDHDLSVPYGDRGGVVIEPMLTDQWYVDAKTLAKPAVEAVENGDVKFVPQQYENMYFSWMRDIQDWCISRQLWWGHRIPAWYDQDGNVYVGRSEEEIKNKYALSESTELTQDNDVLDTWFSSALWTFGTLGWPEKTDLLKTFHPTSTLVTGFDIIFFWVARMMMFTMHFMKDDDGKPQVPFQTIYMTGLIRDEQGHKMSKSKGNVLDPLDMIDGISLDALLEKRTSNMMQPQLCEKIAKRTKKEFPEGIAAHGTDALRFTLTSLASTGRDINWDMSRLEGYRNFCNKLWNAARFVLLHTKDQDLGDSNESREYSVADKWIISQLQLTSEAVNEHFENFRFDLVSQSTYEFVWNEYCDWYLEFAKALLTESDSSEALLRGTRYTLVTVLDNILRLLHPIMPFITEEIWQSFRAVKNEENTTETIMLSAFPLADLSRVDQAAIEQVNWLKELVVAIRNIRGELNIPPGKVLSVLARNADDNIIERYRQCGTFIESVGRVEAIEWINSQDTAPPSATQLVGNLEVLVPLLGSIDVGAEISRLEKELEKSLKETERLSAKLNNEKFVARAPQDVIEAERAKLKSAEQAAAKLESQKSALLNL